MTGIQETQEVLVATNELALVVVKHVKDGVQIGDIGAVVGELISNVQFREALTKAVQNVAQVPAEIKDIDFAEGLELAKLQIAYIPKFVEALKK
jgi:hypothetical protein